MSPLPGLRRAHPGSADGRSLPGGERAWSASGCWVPAAVDHSLAGAARAAYRELGLRDWTYERYDVTADRLCHFCDRTGRPDSWRGLSLTMPLKEPAFQVATQVGEAGRDAVGAINTLVRTDAGWAGENTDVHGLIAALGEVGAHDLADLPHRGGRQRGHARSRWRRSTGSAGARSSLMVRDEPRTRTVAQARRWGLELSVRPIGRVAGPARRRGEHGAARGHGRGGASAPGWWSGTGRGCLR